jgi:L-amino acid N-acyltransferase YncA
MANSGFKSAGDNTHIQKILKKDYPKKVVMTDGRVMAVRPMTDADLDQSLDFFKTLPEEEKMYLRSNVDEPESVKARLKPSDIHVFHRLAAVDETRIIAEATLYKEAFSWKKHVGEIRVLVHPDYQQAGLGAILIRELYEIANMEGLDVLYALVPEEQTAAINIFKRMGFNRELVKKDHVMDTQGESHNLAVMTCNLSELWDRYETLLHHSDTGQR